MSCRIGRAHHGIDESQHRILFNDALAIIEMMHNDIDAKEADFRLAYGMKAAHAAVARLRGVKLVRATSASAVRSSTGRSPVSKRLMVV